MGFFDLFQKNKRKVANSKSSIEDESMNTLSLLERPVIKKKNLNVVEDRKQFIKDSCEQMIEASKQIDEAKIEYQAVTSYLTDMQKIDRIPMEEREDIDDAARKIITLARERAKYQNKKNIKITEAQYKHLELYKDTIPDELQKIKNKEDYNMVVKNDMRTLEGEKGSLLYQKEEIIHQQRYLKGLAIITSIIVISLFGLFVTIASIIQKDMTIPYILTIVMAAVSASYIIYEARKNRYEIKRTERKLNRAIALMNKVKIKYINTNNYLDYTYSKYVVNSSSELRYLWEQYIKVKDEEKRYKSNTELLNLYNETLIKRLRDYKIADPVIWIHQAIAIIDNKEMVEVRHRLNTRRQKLRERIDYNTKLKQAGTKDLQEIISTNEEWKPEVIEILVEYGIHI